MAEVEIHTQHGQSTDTFGQRVGIVVGIIGILLSIVTILDHREHTAAVVHKTEANDQWAFYQAKKIREHNAQIGVALLNALAADPAKVAAISAKLTPITSPKDLVMRCSLTVQLCGFVDGTVRTEAPPAARTESLRQIPSICGSISPSWYMRMVMSKPSRTYVTV